MLSVPGKRASIAVPDRAYASVVVQYSQRFFQKRIWYKLYPGILFIWTVGVYGNGYRLRFCHAKLILWKILLELQEISAGCAPGLLWKGNYCSGKNICSFSSRVISDVIAISAESCNRESDKSVQSCRKFRK